MIPAAFDLVRADSVAAALAVLAEHGDEAKVLAGGQSLIPLLKLRLARPAVLVDVERITALDGITVRDDQVVIGALARHRDLQRSAAVSQHLPLLAHAAGQVGDPQVRNRGTFGGSLVHGDGAADLPAVALALEAVMVVEGPSGRREVPAEDFFLGFLETAVAPDELLVEVRIPSRAGVPWSFQKFTRRAQDWAVVGCAVVGGDRPGVGLINMGSRPLRATSVEEALRSGATASAAAELAGDDGEPTSDIHASAEYRRHLARVLVGRALREAGG